MEQIITLKVDLEYPEEAHHAIDEAVKAYKSDELKWTEAEIAEAKRLALQIMARLCLDGYDIVFSAKTKTDHTTFISVFLSKNLVSERKMGFCMLSNDKWEIWIARCVCLCRAIGKYVPSFIIRKAGECW